jgi:aspartate/methionine/tyrosine aminotransferase
MAHLLSSRQVVLTSPNNPSGYVYSHAEVLRLVDLCRAHDCWLVADQTYHEFLYENAQHVFPCGSKAAISYDKIMHIFSFSKIFGMPGWRVGYIVFPGSLTPHMRKVSASSYRCCR